MKILYLILAHNMPTQTYALADTLIKASADGSVVIHFDKNARIEDYHALQELAKKNEKIALVKQRVACKWGAYSLVEATLNALRQAMINGAKYEYVILLSGACLPSKPIASLEQYLADNNGKEFIEAFDHNWMVGGLRKERYELYFPRGASQIYSHREYYWVRLQKALGIKRKVPNGMTVYFGSQWWALTWDTCKKIVQFLDEHPSIERFFRKTYIPDEMFFQTLVKKLVPANNIAGHGLTFYKFTNYGKPIVFYDDHADYPFKLDKFFYRKVSPEAKVLTKNSLEFAHGDKSTAHPHSSAADDLGYQIKSIAQTWCPVPGQLFYRDQYIHSPEGVLKNAQDPYVVLIGLADHVSDLSSLFKNDTFQVLGRIFSQTDVLEGTGMNEFEGLKSSDISIRNMHPLLYLCRMRARTEKVPVFRWAPGDSLEPLQHVLQDKNALKIIVVADVPQLNDWKRLLWQELGGVLPVIHMPPGPHDHLYEKARQLYEWARVNEILEKTVPIRVVNAFDGEVSTDTIVCYHDCPTITKTARNPIEVNEAKKCIFAEQPWFDEISSALEAFQANMQQSDKRPKAIRPVI